MKSFQPKKSFSWLVWLAANLGGVILGVGLVFIGLKTVLDEASQAVYGIVIGITIGTIIGMAQWLVLRRLFDRAGWWILLTASGWTVYSVLNNLGLLVPAPGVAWIPDMINIAIFGAFLGGFQWLWLKKRIPAAGWWVMACILGGIAGALISDSVNSMLHTDNQIDFLTGSLMLAISTGLTLRSFLRR